MNNLKGNCVVWEWRKNATGYGVILMSGKQFFAHRLAVALSGRSIPKSKICDHLCRNHACINPDHIELVSIGENVLRGEGFAAKFLRRDRCKNGHLFTKENTRIQARKGGYKERHCRECYARREREGSIKRGLVPTRQNKRKYE